MNLRVVLLVLLVVIFTLGGVLISSISFETNSLKDAYEAGTVEIIQNTTAGTVPHVVTVKNTGKKPLMMETGQILVSNSSQDLVVAEDKRINQNSSSFVRAYCFQPNQRAAPGLKLTPSGKASIQIEEIIDQSNLSDIKNATMTQLQIWILVSRDNVNLNSGEASALSERQEISGADIIQELSNARNDLIKALNVTTGELKNINQNGSSTSLNDIINWVNEFINWIKNSFGIS